MIFFNENGGEDGIEVTKITRQGFLIEKKFIYIDSCECSLQDLFTDTDFFGAIRRVRISHLPLDFSWVISFFFLYIFSLFSHFFLNFFKAIFG